jgi:excisionase family DNA binding protein
MSRVKAQSKKPRSAANGFAGDVLTLAEAASYLRLSEEEVLRLIQEQDLPGRRVGTEWRFLQTAIQQWLSQPLSKSGKKGIWGAAGTWRNDPYLDDMLTEIYRRRGRAMTEEG